MSDILDRQGANGPNGSLGSGISIQYVAETGTYRTQFDDTDILPSRAVIQVLSKVSMDEPVEFEPLYHSIDPEALDQLITTQANQKGDRVVEFTHLDCRITVKSYGIIEVEPETDPQSIDPEA